MSYNTLETGRRIQKLRKAKGLTQEQLAERLNVSAVHLAKIETGKRGCSLDILIDFAALGRSFTYQKKEVSIWTVIFTISTAARSTTPIWTR